MKVEDLFENNSKKVIIIKGNPAKMKGMENLANRYYQKIAEYVKRKGFEVEFDSGEPYTCPDLDAAFWIGHSRGADRKGCIDNKDQWKFLEFGIWGGYNHPEDEKWQRSGVDHKTNKSQPPKQHFYFTNEQRNAIDKLIRKLSHEGVV